MTDMAPGTWLQEGSGGTPLYVVNPDHVQRLLASGYQVIADPRLPAELSMVNPDADEQAVAGGLQVLAAGGVISGGGMAIVGEPGPELINLPPGTTIKENV